MLTFCKARWALGKTEKNGKKIMKIKNTQNQKTKIRNERNIRLLNTYHVAVNNLGPYNDRNNKCGKINSKISDATPDQNFLRIVNGTPTVKSGIKNSFSSCCIGTCWIVALFHVFAFESPSKSYTFFFQANLA